MLPCGHIETDADGWGCLSCRAMELERMAQAMGREVRNRCRDCRAKQRRVIGDEVTPWLQPSCAKHLEVP